MEYLDIYNDKQCKTGKIVERGYECAPDEHIFVVHLCIFNSKGELLIQQRALNKSMFPGVWDLSAGGHVLSGETTKEAAMRETKEELGFHDFDGMKFAFMEPFSYVFDDFYVLKQDVDLESLTLQKSEIETVAWANKEEVFAKSKRGDFVNYEPECLEKIFAAAEV